MLYISSVNKTQALYCLLIYVCPQGVQSLESLTSVLSHCLSKWRRYGTSAQSCSQLQLVCWTTSHLAVCLGKLLEAQGPHLVDVTLLLYNA